MVLGIISLILVLGVAYMHWTWGFFSAAISMALAVVAATLALGYYEPVVTGLLGGRMADVANGLVICVIFLIVYGVGRIAFDALIPGNVRLPLYVDKIGGGLCGFIAGVFAVGTVMIAAQSYPFGISVAFFDRYPQGEADRQVVVPFNSRNHDAILTEHVATETGEQRPNVSKRNNLLLPADRWLVDYMTHQSRAGALATGVASFEAAHPDLLDELFFQRVGIEPGAKHVALNMGSKEEISVTALATRTRFERVLDHELDTIRSGQGGVLDKKLAEPDANGDAFLIVRAVVKFEATEKDGKLRLSPGSARLVLNGKQYFPIGTLHHDGQTLFLNRIDDYLMAQPAEGSGPIPIDFVFKLPSTDLAAAGVTVAAPARRVGAPATPARGTAAADAAGGPRLKPGTLFELKRYGRVELSTIDVATDALPRLDVQLPRSADQQTRAPGIMRKLRVLEQLYPPSAP